MNRLVLILTGVLICASACNDYVAKKRDGLKPFTAEEESREAQEESGTKK